MLSFNSNGTNNISGKRTQFLQIKVDQDSDAFAGTAEQGGSLGFSPTNNFSVVSFLISDVLEVFALCPILS